MSIEVENLFELDADLHEFAEQIDVELQTVIRKIVISLHDKIVERTPVDTGRARASWGVEELEPDDFEEGPDYFDPTGADRDAKQKAEAAVKRDFDPYTIFWIFNNLPYILALEYGHSTQAPTGMVQIALAEVEAEILAEMK